MCDIKEWKNETEHNATQKYSNQLPASFLDKMVVLVVTDMKITIMIVVAMMPEILRIITIIVHTSDNISDPMMIRPGQELHTQKTCRARRT